MNQFVNDFNGTVRTYYDELKKYKPLSKAKERRLLKKCKNGSISAKNEIIEANLRFVFDIAKHYTGRGVSISELISEGNMGLLKAIDKFDYTKDVKFISYAVWWIRQYIVDFIKRRNSMNFVEVHEGSESKKNVGVADDDDDSYPSDDREQCDEGYHESEVKRGQMEIIAKILDVLDERERDVIESYYGINDKKEMSLTDIGKKYNLSSERARQIKMTSLKKLRSEMLLLDYSDYL